MRHHLFFVGFILLLTLGILGACTTGTKMLDAVKKPLASITLQSPPPAPTKPVEAPPPSPVAAQDQVNLPPGTRSITQPVLPTHETTTRIALILPLSGPHAALGKDLQDAAQLALFDIKNPDLIMIPLDSAGTSQGAIAAMNKAVAQKATIVLGPLFSAEAAAIAPIAKSHNIPIVSFSNNTQLTQQGVFVFGFMPQQQVARVLQHALQRGIRDFYVIAPDDAFGAASIATLEAMRSRSDFTLHVTERYNPATNQGMVSAARMVASHILEQRKKDSTPRERGLLIPEGGTKLLELSKLLSGFGLNANDVRLLGSGQWDDLQLGNYKRLYGGWFATASPTQRTLFQKNFEKNYGYSPIRIASVAYDAVALVGFVNQQSGNRFSTASFVNQRGFAGVDGVFRFTPERVAERSLAVLEVIPNGFEIVDEAPKVLPSYSGE